MATIEHITNPTRRAILAGGLCTAAAAVPAAMAEGGSTPASPALARSIANHRAATAAEDAANKAYWAADTAHIEGGNARRGPWLTLARGQFGQRLFEYEDHHALETLLAHEPLTPEGREQIIAAVLAEKEADANERVRLRYDDLQAAQAAHHELELEARCEVAHAPCATPADLWQKLSYLYEIEWEILDHPNIRMEFDGVLLALENALAGMPADKVSATIVDSVQS